MKLKNVLLVVKDIERSKKFYRELFGLEVIRDFGVNVMLTEGLVLQEQKSWEELTGSVAEFGTHNAELYFEEQDMNAFLEKLDQYGQPIAYFNRCIMQESGRRVLRIYDPDGHVIEVGEAG